MMGTWTSNTMIRAVKLVANGTGSEGRHRTLPIDRWIGSIEVKKSLAFAPAAAQGTESSSTSIAVCY